MRDWNDVEKSVSDGPWSAMKVAVIGIVCIMVVGTGVSLVGGALGWFGEAAQVAREEFGPRAMLKKYEWFKDASAQLDKKVADIQVYAMRLDEFKDISRKDMDRTDKDEKAQINTELAGVTASYNGLAAEYNSQMAKFNWAFANAGQLPQGAATVLPREYKSYSYGGVK